MGTERQGFMMDVSKEHISLAQKRSGKGLTFEIGIGSIKSMQVYDEVQQ